MRTAGMQAPEQVAKQANSRPATWIDPRHEGVVDLDGVDLPDQYAQ